MDMTPNLAESLNFHNRRSTTCGKGKPLTYCLKGRTDLKSRLSGGSVGICFVRRSMVSEQSRTITCGYENPAHSGDRQNIR